MEIIVCEDDAAYLKSIPEAIAQWARENGHADIAVRTFGSSEDFLQAWNAGLSPDILFLDIEFPSEINGMEVARQVRKTDENVPIVFITNYDAYLREGYAVRALRYLGKPVRSHEIAMCLDIAYNQYALSHNEFFIFSTAGRRIAIRYAEILFFEAQSPCTLIHQHGSDQPMKLRSRFGEVTQKVPQELFVPCHRSYVVNLIHVRCVKRTELLLSNGQWLPVSRPYIAALNDAFDSYYQEGCAYVRVEPV